MTQTTLVRSGIKIEQLPLIMSSEFVLNVRIVLRPPFGSSIPVDP